MIKTGSKVQRSRGSGTATGTVQETYDESITKIIKGNKVTRHGESGNKALYIQQDDGDYVLKNENEVQRVKQ